MNSEQARTLVKETFPQEFDKGRFRQFAVNLLNHIDESKAQAWNTSYIKDAFKDHVKGYERLGTYTSPEDEKLDVLIVHLTTESKLQRTRTAIRNFVADHLKTRDGKDAALVAFVSPTEKQWRFSYVKMEYAAVEKKDGKVGVQTKLTPARRSSYIVGEGESCHTAQSRFLDLLQDTENHPTLAQIEDTFSVEAVTKEFFEQYKELFLELAEELEAISKKDKTIGAEFASKQVNTTDFAKKLMGQIVFLYFLQKKGWLGVPKGKDWGDGPHNFLRQLFDGKFGGYKNFFNDILEPLFYDTLATDRGHSALCEIFKCRIPFLNGGLFEPLSGYDWQKTEIIIPNTLFSNSTTTKMGDRGTGILDVFDRYNFTVNEAEPLEKEVAIDPEMLGKVFENLLEVKERKSKGSFYTPRDIVHYMCQESLINYLDTSINSTSETIGTEKRTQGLLGDEKVEQTLLTAAVRKELIPRADLELWIHQSDQFANFAAAIAAGTKGDHYPKPPKPIEVNARLLDDKLADVTVCDPAIGSGAFPVGMMQEIVRARSALTPYFNDVRDRTAYHFKRHAIQNSLYGVDIDPGAVEIAKLRLWLSLVVDEDDVKQIKPLPNLDYKVVTGNSLLGFPFKTKRLEGIEKLKIKFFDEPDHDAKAKLKKQIDDDLIAGFAAAKKSYGYAINFDFELCFSEVFSKRQGFDIVLANPPYIDSEGMTKDSPELRKVIQASYKMTKGNWDIYIAFYEKGFGLLGNCGALSFITPDKWISKPFGDEMRIKTTANIFSILRAGRSIFENAKVDSIVTVYTKATQEVIRIMDYVDARIHELRNIHKNTLRPPYTYDWLFSENVEWLEKFSTCGSILSEIGLCENACATSDAYKLQELITEEPKVNDANQYLKIINTGTIGKYTSKWGQREMVYLGQRFIRPVVSRKKFLSEFPNSYGQKSIKPKLIVKGLNLLDACLDLDGTVIPGKTTLMITADSLDALKLLLAIVNNPIAIFYLKEKYPASSYNQGTTFTKDMINNLPIPADLLRQKAPIIKLVDALLSAKQRDASADVTKLEREINELVCGLYGFTEDEKILVKGAAK